MNIYNKYFYSRFAAMEIRYVGGVFGGNIRPTPFLCLTLKMLQIQPEKDIVVEFIKNEEFKYVRALGAFYLRLTGTSVDCYKYLEPLYNDNRKLRHQNRAGHFEIIHMDEYIDQLLRNDRVCDIILPRIQKRHILEENNELEPKVSALDDDLDEDGSDEEAHNPIEDDIRQELYDLPKKSQSRKETSSKRDERRDDRKDDRRHFERSSDKSKRDEREKERDRYSRDYDRRYDDSRKRDKDRDYERSDRNDRNDRSERNDRSDRKRHYERRSRERKY